MKTLASMILGCLLVAGCMAPLGMSQTAAATAESQETTVSGTIASSTRDTLVVKAEDGSFHLYVYDRYTVRSGTVATGARVRVVSRPGSESGYRVAIVVTVSGSAPPATAQDKTNPEVIPPAMRDLEHDLSRQVSRYGAGIRGGAGLDPEVLLIGVHARLGPFFHRDVSLRPNVEFGFGEVTKLFAFNLEGVYRLPLTPRTARYSTYFGLGPSFIFSHRNFEEAAAGDNGIDFGEFDYHTGLNILAGVEFRSGAFMELKTTVWASPHLRLIFGYTF